MNGKRAKMNSIMKEIKEQYEYYKKNCPPVPICGALPFNTYDQMWMYYHLFPEVLQVYDEWVQEEYKKYPRLLTPREHQMFYTTFPHGEAMMFPCWVLLEEEILRIMAECKIL